MTVPTATYRLQLQPVFDLRAAEAVLPYVRDLGASHVYLSPVLAAVPGSTHGYDVVDHDHVAPHLGGDAAFAAFCDAAAAAGLGVVIDIVPNHVSVDGDHNARWLDVLELGPASPSADWFDIDWTGREAHHRGVVVLPVLGDLYGEVLAAGEIGIVRDGARFHATCPGHRFPLAPRSLCHVLDPAADQLARAAHDEPDAGGTLADAADTLRFVSDALAGPPDARTDTARARWAASVRAARRVLARTLDEPAVAAAVDAVLADLTDDRDAVHRILEDQHHRLAYWRTAAAELDYRRFFDVTTLAAIRVELDSVFDAVHRLPVRWVAEGRVDGIRVDHPDGLADPRGYFARLRHAAPSAWIVAEKILEPGEELPDDWPVDGTTGYDALRLVGGLLVDPAGLDVAAEVERAVHARWNTEPADPATLRRTAKREAIETLLGADVERIVDVAVRATARRRDQRDHSRPDLRRAVVALAVELDVYRTYAEPGRAGSAGRIRPVDVARIDAAASAALAGDETLDPRLVTHLADVLALRSSGAAEGDDDEAELVVRFQQLTGPATAKGMEDTAWYRANAFVAANEVGGDPFSPAVTPDEFHDGCIRRQTHWPASMTTLSTHDTKRSADVRARLAVLSEPGLRPAWPELADRWIPRLLDRWPAAVEPHAPTFLLALQTMLGAWPIDGRRLGAYLEKATREAKERTSWTRPDVEFEAAVATLAAAVDDPALQTALDDDVEELVRLGWRNSLVQTALGLTQPGVPDVYQGTETGELSLVDPDNRRPVDHPTLASALRTGAVVDPEQPQAKLGLTAALLDLRRRRPAAFGAGPAGAHRPLAVEGVDADRVVAYARGADVVVAVVRFPTRGRLDDRTTVEFPTGTWRPVTGAGSASTAPASAPSGLVTASGAAGVALGPLIGEWPVGVWERDGDET